MATIHYSGPAGLNLIYENKRYQNLDIKGSRLISKVYQASISNSELYTIISINNWTSVLFREEHLRPKYIKFIKGWNLTEITGQIFTTGEANLIYIPKLVKLKTGTVGLWFTEESLWYPVKKFTPIFDLRVGFSYLPRKIEVKEK